MSLDGRPRLPLRQLVLCAGVAGLLAGCGSAASASEGEDARVARRLDALGRHLQATVGSAPAERSPIGELVPVPTADPFPDPPDPPGGN